MKRGEQLLPQPGRGTARRRRVVEGPSCRSLAPHRQRSALPPPRFGEDLMIIGIGSDLCNIERIENSLERFGQRFLNRVFTEVEKAKAASRPHTRAGTLAK